MMLRCIIDRYEANPMLSRGMIFFLLCTVSVLSCTQKNEVVGVQDKKNQKRVVIVIKAFNNNKITQSWREVLGNRASVNYIDSLANVSRPLEEEEIAWQHLIESKQVKWNNFKDSLQVPFGFKPSYDTTHVLLGYLGSDDAFTFRHQTICFDLSALLATYGSASEKVNDNRIDRLFAHEYSHLLSKEWSKLNNLKLSSFKDSILWECIYEGIGMYRSMSAKWFPVEGQLSAVSSEVFKELYPLFANKIAKIQSSKDLTEAEKTAIHKNLSRGPMKKKWGALPVGVWLALEAKGDDKNLKQIIDQGPKAVILLAKKYLPAEYKDKIKEDDN